jgi:enamine deaminase RidA (YjgF/YER057c/UK114 family)
MEYYSATVHIIPKSTIMSYEKKFMAIKDLPPEPVVPPNCNFVMYHQVGKMLILSGYGPLWGSNVPKKFQGKVPKDVTVKEGYNASKLTAMNLLLITRQAIKTLDKVDKIISVEGFVNSQPSFTEHPSVINGCSDFLVEIFGINGHHTRSAIGSNSLAFGISVEISMTLLLK